LFSNFFVSSHNNQRDKFYYRGDTLAANFHTVHPVGKHCSVPAIISGG